MRRSYAQIQDVTALNGPGGSGVGTASPGDPCAVHEFQADRATPAGQPRSRELTGHVDDNRATSNKKYRYSTRATTLQNSVSEVSPARIPRHGGQVQKTCP